MSKRIAAVTGGYGALGSAVIEHLHGLGYALAAIDFANEAPGALRGKALTIGGVDLADPNAARAAHGKVVSELGGMDVLINIAGGFVWESIAEGDAQTWERMYTLNVKTAVTSTMAALEHIRRSSAGRIINIGAASAMKSSAGVGAYTASKSGVMRFTESLADELKGTATTVNAVLPSIIDTPTNRRDMPKADFSKWVTPLELAHVIAFLASEQASAVTGALVPVVGRV